MVVAKVDIPSLGIFVDQSYELRSVYMHGTSLQTGNSIVENIPLETLTLGNRKDGDQIVTGRGGSYPSNYQTIIMLYSPLYHENKYPDGVKVTPEVSLKFERNCQQFNTTFKLLTNVIFLLFCL